MRPFLVFCAICCFIAVFHMPIGYYAFLRCIVSLGSILVIGSCIQREIHTWIVFFVIILVLFNPILPFYLYQKGIWVIIDVIVGILFLLVAFFNQLKPIKEKAVLTTTAPPKEKIYTRDRIISMKLTKKEN